MENGLLLRGLELRYVLTLLLTDAGRPLCIDEIVRWIEGSRYSVAGRPSKTVSDALRWEIGHGRVVRVGRGRYASTRFPRQTRSRMRARVRTLADRRVDEMQD